MDSPPGDTVGPYRVAVESLSKRFGAIAANADVNFELRDGEIHAIVGENGAGKSTLMAMLYGLLRPDSGTIRIDGEPRLFRNSREAIALGIGMVHQHYMLAPRLNAAENIVLGYEPGSVLRSTAADARRAVAALMQRFDFSVPLDRPVGELPIGARQRVEILKALYRGARILILDEPTAVLAPAEVDALFARLRLLRDGGISIIFISHKLREVLALSDRVTVMRRGRSIKTLATAATDAAELAELMVGTTLPGAAAAARTDAPAGEPLLALAGITVRAGARRPVVDHVDLVVRAGEIVGIAAIEGNGQSELLEVVAGVTPPTAGRIELMGRDVTTEGVTGRRSAGLAYVPEDRHRDAMALGSTAAECFLSTRRPRGALGWLRRGIGGADREHVGRQMRAFDVRPPDPDVVCAAMSGGNQQKLIFARELSSAPRFVVLGQPTRGIDIGASLAMFTHIRAACARGAGILLLSADLDELFSNVDRIVVMFAGRIVAELDPRVSTPRDAGAYMTGGRDAH
jgi:simple sugar transport system ATP-binding protein